MIFRLFSFSTSSPHHDGTGLRGQPKFFIIFFISFMITFNFQWVHFSYLLGRERSSLGWFVPQMLTAVWAGLGQSQNLRAARDPVPWLSPAASQCSHQQGVGWTWRSHVWCRPPRSHLHHLVKRPSSGSQLYKHIRLIHRECARRLCSQLWHKNKLYKNKLIYLLFISSF